MIWNNCQKIILIIRSKSLRYILFRTRYEMERRTGLLAWKYPVMQNKIRIPSLSEWQEKGRGWFYEGRASLNIYHVKSLELNEKMDHILKGDVLFFGKTWKYLGLDYDWVTNPETSYHYNIKQHWTKIEDFSKEAGDIKFVWEKSRFSWLYTIIRYDYHFNEDHSEFVVSQILDWIEKNPLNCGPNYKCSQEISIRLINWLFALNYYKHNSVLKKDIWETIMTSVYWQTVHVYKNINFSRIAVRNNHAITETLALYLIGLMCPQFPNAAKWKSKGKQWFEKEIDYQITDDGTFIQNSMNYHRVVVQLLTYAIAIADAYGEKYDVVVYEKAYKSVNFLFQCQDPSSGWLPNYGANDGALFFPLNDADFRDYRPQLDALHGLLTGQPLYESFLEDACWVGAKVPSFRKRYPKIEKQNGLITFVDRGYFLIREKETLTFLRCSNGCTGQMHIDIWYQGENVLLDAGSYKYNTEESLIKYFAGTESHNSVMLGDYDQMQKGPRFMWFFPTKVMKTDFYEAEDTFVFEGTVNCFRQLADNIILRRKITKTKKAPIWIVVDKIDNKPEGILMRQLWHTNRDNLNLESEEATIVVGDGWCSDYYGMKYQNTQIEVRSSSDFIETVIKI